MRCFTSFSDHDVVIMAITDSQDVGSYTVPSTGIHKALHCLLILQSTGISVSFNYTHLNYANITTQTGEANNTHSVRLLDDTRHFLSAAQMPFLN